MDNDKILYAILAVAVLALIGRLIINSNIKKNKQISWARIIVIVVDAVVFGAVFVNFDAYRAQLWWQGPAIRTDARGGNNICGREAGYNIARFTRPADECGELYYALEVTELTPTGYYRLKDFREAEKSVDRDVRETEGNTNIITRKTSTFSITRNPGERAAEYLPYYIATLSGDGKTLVAMEEADAQIGTLPVAMLRPTDERQQQIIRQCADSTIISDYSFVAFNEQAYAKNSFNYVIYRAIAALIVLIVLIIVEQLIFRKYAK